MDVDTLQQIQALFCATGAVKTRRYNLKWYEPPPSCTYKL